jgi:uncharacterized membrane protein YfcA
LIIPLEIVLGFGIGLSLGLLGGGGSILTVPALVYLVGQAPQSAVASSLVIVGANSLMGALFHHSQGTLNWRVALIFGGAGMLASYLSARLSSHLSPVVLLVAFAGLMLVIGIMLFFRPDRPADEPHAARPPMLVLASGAGVGVLTGVLGVGGGFLVVPALVMLLGLPVQAAIGTSLAIIAMNSAAGFLGHASSGSLDLVMILVFTAAGLLGAFTGSRLAHRLPSSGLQKAFAVFVVILGLFLLYDNLPKLL